MAQNRIKILGYSSQRPSGPENIIMSISEAQVQGALKEIINADTGKDYIAGRHLRNLKIDGSNVSLGIELGYPAKSRIDAIGRQVAEQLKTLPGIGKVDVNVYSKIVAHTVQKGTKLVPGVRNVIAVASGKGGVGKSTTAANLALALAAEGARVGLLDADIYGPSQPTMLGVSGQPDSPDGKSMLPLQAHGLQVMSIGFLIDQDTPMVWRGPMVSQALQQLLNDTHWDDLDYLVIDLPPGTGDMQLTLAQKRAGDGGRDRHHAAGHRLARCAARG
jgi:ATP-binding protein involved in chromosome partitioning